MIDRDTAVDNTSFGYGACLSGWPDAGMSGSTRRPLITGVEIDVVKIILSVGVEAPQAVQRVDGHERDRCTKTHKSDAKILQDVA